LLEKKGYTLCQTILYFNDPEEEVFSKHGKKEKMLVTSTFFFSIDVFHPSQNKF
jgi:hypothetical protein